MKRHPGLVPLSHDHHHGLVHAARLTKAAEGQRPLGPTVDDFLAFYPGELLRHFGEEEETLGPFMADRFGAEDPQRIRLFAEHAVFHDLVRALREAREAMAGEARLASAAGEVGRMLERHIRFEERELFPRLEDACSEEELQALGVHFTGGPRCGQDDG